MKRITKQTYQIFWRHARRYPWVLSIILAAIIAATAVQTLIPLLYRDFFDVLTEDGGDLGSKADTLVGIIALILGINLLNSAFYRTSGYLYIRFQAKTMRDMINSSFEYLHKHSVGFFNNKFVGSLVRRVNRLVYGFETISDKVVWDILTLLVTITVILTVLFTERPLFAVILLVWTIIMLVLNYAFSQFKLKFDVAQAESDTEVTGDLADTITNNINLKMFTGLSDELTRFKKLTRKQLNSRLIAWNWEEHMNAIQSILFVILEFGVFYAAIQLWADGLITIGDFVLLQAYVLTLFNRVWNLSRVIRNIYENLADSEEMIEILNTPHGVKDKPRAKGLNVGNGTVEFRNVDFAYHKTRNVLNAFSLKIQPGEKVGLVGPSGSGKTTLASLLLRYFDVSRGGIYIDGQNIADVTQESLRQHVALVPQDPILFHRTVKENIQYGNRDATNGEMLKASESAHAHEFVKDLSQGYDTFVGERGVKLSGGERQRVAIARAILKNAPILVLDEATSALDSQSEHLIQDALANLMKDKTAIVVAHRLSTIMNMDRIVVVKDGKIIEQGTHEELTQKDGLYSDLWDMQAGGFIG